MAPYEYSALDEDASEIRLMTLLPGRFEDDISIAMETVVLTEEHIPHYEALSYVWGSPENPENITVKARTPGRSRPRRLEACSHGTISVTQNLATALPYLRKRDKPRVLWIDAICVNQQDIAERGHQVKRMAAVYSMANQVIIWLGPESQNSTLALRAIHDLGSQVRVDWNIEKVTSVSTGETLTHGDDPFNDDEMWESVGDLLRRPWFERLWIWQEVRLAREAYLFCGNEGLPWESFREAMSYLYRSYTPPGVGRLIAHCYGISDYTDRRVTYLYGACGALIDLLETARLACCSDPRDKIFAVLSLADERDTGGLDADYSKPAEAVFQDLVLHYTSNLQSLDILRHCELRDETGVTELPTWVPDWTVPRLCRTLPFSECCRNSKPRVGYQDGRVLAATGVHVALIKSVETLPQPAYPFQILHEEDTVDAIRALIVPKVNPISLSERDAMVNSLCRTICCSAFAENYSPPSSDFPSFAACRKNTYDIIDTTRGTVLEESHESILYLARVGYAFKGRSFFTTNDGYIGLAPTATKPGDEVCILLGCRTPLVLRRCEDGHHKVVGECYIDGFMDGKACLGPLPSKLQPVEHYFEEFSRPFDAFLDHQTGEIQIEDPRLGPLPAGWYIVSHEAENAVNLYANIDTGEITRFDPRMTPEGLTARGVELREFQLV